MAIVQRRRPHCQLRAPIPPAGTRGNGVLLPFPHPGKAPLRDRRRCTDLFDSAQAETVTAAPDAWAVVQLAELVLASEDELLAALRTLSPDARASMPEDGAWVLTGADAEGLRTLLTEHSDRAERLRLLAERLPECGVSATSSDVRDGATTALADGILDPVSVQLAASALDRSTGWIALAGALVSTNVRCGWTELRADDLLRTFRDADPEVVAHVLAEAGVRADEWWATLNDEATRRLAGTLRQHARRS